MGEELLDVIASSGKVSNAMITLHKDWYRLEKRHKTTD
jgi:hypothetical protein